MYTKSRTQAIMSRINKEKKKTVQNIDSDKCGLKFANEDHLDKLPGGCSFLLRPFARLYRFSPTIYKSFRKMCVI